MAYEERVSSETLAEWLGVSQRNVQQLTKDGILHKAMDDKGTRYTSKYDLKAALLEYVKYLRDRAGGRTSATEAELKKKKLEADIALKESQGELHQLKTAIATGQYISVDEVQMDYEKFFTTFKNFATSMPARVIGLAAGSMDAVEARSLEKEMAEEVNRLLGAFVVAGTETKPAPKLQPKKRGRPRKDAKA